MRDRPRERLEALGAEPLNDAELVGLVLRTGGPDGDAVALAAQLFDVPVLSLVAPGAKTTAVDWLRGLSSVDSDDGNVHRLYLSPELLPTSPTAPLDALPLRDRSVVALADRLLVFHLRAGGQLDECILDGNAIVPNQTNVLGINHGDNSDRTGMTHGSVRVNLCRGMALLRPLLAREGWR